MNADTWELYCEYIERVNDPAAAASLTLADMMQTARDTARDMPSTSFTVSQAAKRLNLSDCTVYELCQQGKLSHHRFGRNIRFTQKDLDTYIKETAVQSLGQSTDSPFQNFGSKPFSEALAKH